MTRVYKSAADAGFRVLIVGAGAYPNAKAGTGNVPILKDLQSIGPSVLAFVGSLLGPWHSSLSAPLVSIDLLLNGPEFPGAATWTGYGREGEVAAGTQIEEPTQPNIVQALAALKHEGTVDDTLLLLFCGHGFSREERFFLPSDFGTGLNPWSPAIKLDQLALGLRQFNPRVQWLFWDCCADIPQEALDVIGDVGSGLIGVSAAELASASRSFGELNRFGIASSPVGAVAYGIAGQPSRFMEMLIEAVDQVGATRKSGGDWWITDRGLVDALQTYVQRHPELDESFYSFVMPFNSDAMAPMRLRKLAQPPVSTLITRSDPRPFLVAADLKIARAGAPPGEYVYNNHPPRTQSVFCCQVPAQLHYTVSAQFNGQEGAKIATVFADLPVADAVEFAVP